MSFHIFRVVLTVNDVLVRKLILNTYKTLLTRGFVLCRPEKKFTKRETLYGDKMLPGGLAAIPETFYFVLAVGLWQLWICLPLPPDSRS